MPPDLVKLQRTPREVARWQRAQQELLGGRHGVALARYRELVQQYPGVIQLWFELGMAATAQLEFKLAEEAFRRSAELARHDAEALVLLGQQYHRLRRLDRARECFERAVEANSASAHARLSLAAWYERERRVEDALASVNACLAKYPGDAQALCLKAMLLHRTGQNSQAETLLRDLIKADPKDPNARYSSRHLLAALLDESGQYAEALRWLYEAKALLRQTTNVTKLEQDYDRADRRRRELMGALRPGRVGKWREEKPASNGSRLALLGGHPRSGTTLVEQILGAHPEVVAIDESEAFVQEISEQLAPMQAQRGLTLDALDRLPSGRRTELQRRYFKSLLREVAGDVGRHTENGALNEKLLLDKNPGHTALLHLWLRLFPESKLLIALRDPRDVVLSCFFQNLMLTSTNANFLSLERAAKHYSDLMDVWLRLRTLGGFEWMETRYEDVVNNVEAEGRRITEFLGLSWHANQANHREVALSKVLFAPTYNDVTKPVHSRAVGRWQHYAEAVAPIQERLSPYCKAFGYPT
jgi:tetratricopeptide (TPR) repeat protein